MPTKKTITILAHANGPAEYKDVGSGLTTFRCWTKESWKNKKTDEWDAKFTTFKINVWGEYGKKLVGKIEKGTVVFVTGKPEADAWIGKDGEAHAVIAITADNRDVFVLGQMEKKPAASVDEGSEDLPF